MATTTAENSDNDDYSNDDEDINADFDDAIDTDEFIVITKDQLQTLREEFVAQYAEGRSSGTSTTSVECDTRRK